MPYKSKCKTYNCLYCNTRVRSHYHFYTDKHDYNVIKYKQNITDTLLKQKLDDLIRQNIMSYII